MRGSSTSAPVTYSTAQLAPIITTSRVMRNDSKMQTLCMSAQLARIWVWVGNNSMAHWSEVNSQSRICRLFSLVNSHLISMERSWATSLLVLIWSRTDMWGWKRSPLKRMEVLVWATQMLILEEWVHLMKCLWFQSRHMETTSHATGIQFRPRCQLI